MPVQDEDFAVLNAQNEEFARYHNSRAIIEYTDAMRDWRINALVERGYGRPLPIKPVPGYSWEAVWAEPHGSNRPVLLKDNIKQVCPELPGIPPVELPPVEPVSPLALTVRIGEHMGRDSKNYFSLPGDNVPNGVTFRKVARLSIGGWTEFYERLI